MSGGIISVSDEVVVEASASEDTASPALAKLADGRFVVVWGDVSEVYAQIFSAGGTASTQPFKVAFPGVRTIAVAGLADGGFVVTWDDPGVTTGDLDDGGVGARIYSASGEARGAAFLVNTETRNSQTNAEVSALDNGNFVVSWSDFSGMTGDTDGYGVVAQMFSASGQKIGDAFLVNSETKGYQFGPSITSLAGDGFIATWVGDHPDDTDGFGLVGRIFRADGSPVSEDFLVNTAIPGSQFGGASAQLVDGNIVVTWINQNTSAPDEFAIRAQILSADGKKIGSEISVEAKAGDSQGYVQIAALANGAFVVTWTETTGQDFYPGLGTVHGQLFAASGVKLGEEFTVHPPREENQWFASVEGLANGNFAVTWTAGPFVFDEDIVLDSDVITRVFRVDSPPRITSGGGGESTSVVRAENVTRVTTVAATGQVPGAALAYTIAGGADASLFTIDRKTGVLSFANAPDFESPNDAGRNNVYEVNVRVSDSYQTDEQAVVVRVFDINEITGSDKADRLIGSAGDDAISGGSGADYLAGGAGSDILDGGAGGDKLLGGAGNDVYIVDSADDRVYETVTTAGSDTVDAGGTETVVSAVSFSLARGNSLRFVERLTLTGTADLDGTGNALANIITGNDGANRLSGGAGADTLQGGLGHDRLDGGTGSDRMFGGDGNDTYIVESAGDRVYETPTSAADDMVNTGGLDTVISALSYTLGRFVENLSLTGRLNLNGTGNERANLMTGNDGANVLKGEAGKDALQGGRGNDKLFGGAQADLLTGGAGKDMFVFDTLEAASSSRDAITDFSTTEGDKLLFSRAIFTGFAQDGALAEDAFHAAAGAVRARDAADRIIYNTTTGVLYYDADGLGGVGARPIALLGSSLHPALAVSDLMIVA